MPDIQPIQDLATLRAVTLAEHYQKTMELVIHNWERRSRQFVTLVAVLAGAALVAFARPLIAPALKAAFLKYVPLTTKEELDRLDALTPVAGDLILAFLVIGVLLLDGKPSQPDEHDYHLLRLPRGVGAGDQRRLAVPSRAHRLRSGR